MTRHIEVVNLPSVMTDDEEAVEDTEGDRGHGEEVHGCNRFPVIRKKRAPALGWLGNLSVRVSSSGRPFAPTRQTPSMASSP
jgi:hypothetical protein